MTEASGPIINLENLEFARTIEHGDRFGAKLAPVGIRLGAQKLGYNVTSVAPGKRAFPLHNHHENEEMFLILEGSGLLRYGLSVPRQWEVGAVAGRKPGMRPHEAPFAGFYDESKKVDYYDGE